MSLPTLESLAYEGCDTLWTGHWEPWWYLGSSHLKYTVGTPRDPQTNFHDPAISLEYFKRVKALGFKAVMPNCSVVGTGDDHSFGIAMTTTGQAGIKLIVNIDCRIYRNTLGPPLTLLKAFVAHIRQWVFPLPNYVKWNGKYVVTHFVDPTDDPAWFAEVRAENPDVEFVYNQENMGPSQMWWGVDNSPEAFDAWCTKYATRKDGYLYIPTVGIGFNDDLNGYSCWNQPDPAKGIPGKAARIYPPGFDPFANPPQMANLLAHFAVYNKHYSVTNQPDISQVATLNDCQEGTCVGPYMEGSQWFNSRWLSVPAAAPTPTPTSPTPTPAPTPTPTPEVPHTPTPVRVKSSAEVTVDVVAQTWPQPAQVQLTTSSTLAAPGEVVPVFVRVSGTFPGAGPTGTVDLLVDGVVVQANVPLTMGSASCQIPLGTVGKQTIEAIYNGDSRYY